MQLCTSLLNSSTLALALAGNARMTMHAPTGTSNGERPDGKSAPATPDRFFSTSAAACRR